MQPNSSDTQPKASEADNGQVVRWAVPTGAVRHAITLYLVVLLGLTMSQFDQGRSIADVFLGMRGLYLLIPPLIVVAAAKFLFDTRVELHADHVLVKRAWRQERVAFADVQGTHMRHGALQRGTVIPLRVGLETPAGSRVVPFVPFASTSLDLLQGRLAAAGQAGFSAVRAEADAHWRARIAAPMKEDLVQIAFALSSAVAMGYAAIRLFAL